MAVELFRAGGAIMDGPRVVLVIGNGLNLAYRCHATRLALPDTRYPLQWGVRTPWSGTDPLITYPEFRSVQRAILYYNSYDEKVDNDFDILLRIQSSPTPDDLCDDIRANDPSSQNSTNINIQHRLIYTTRQYLSMAFSWYHYQYAFGIDRKWHWAKWFYRKRNSIALIISFNYDLLLECMMLANKVDFYHIGISGAMGPMAGIPLFKPHGSINFRHKLVFAEDGSEIISDDSVSAITLADVDFPITQIHENNLFYLYKDGLIPCLVLPGEVSNATSYHDNALGYARCRAICRSATNCIFAGLRYWKCDRPELDAIMDSVSPEAKFTVVNPHPDCELIKKARARFRRVSIERKEPPRFL